MQEEATHMQNKAVKKKKTHMQNKVVKKKAQKEEKQTEAEMKHSYRTVGKERGTRKGRGRREGRPKGRGRLSQIELS